MMCGNWMSHYIESGFNIYTRYKDIQLGMVVFDVGSGLGGGFSLYAVFKGAKKVFAIEPWMKRYDKQNQNFEKFGVSNTITSLPIALWFRNEALHIQGDHIRSQGVKVEGKTLDQLVEDYKVEKVDFIKIDTEGCELPIIFGSHKTILSDHPIFSIAAYHGRRYTVDGRWLEKPPPPTITRYSQMDAIIKLFKERYPSYTYVMPPETPGIITLFVS